MARKKLFFQIFPSYLLIIFITVCALIIYASTTLKTFYISNIRSELKIRAELIQPEVVSSLNSGQLKKLNDYCRKLRQRTGTRITIINYNGKVLADSDEKPELMDNHGNRPEISNAIKGKSHWSIRYSNTLKKDMLYVATPVTNNNHLKTVIRTSLPITFINEELKKTYVEIVIGALLVALIAALISFFITKRISKPIEELRTGAAKFAQGDFSKRLPLYDIEEINNLAEAMNLMSREIQDNLITLKEKNDEVNAILLSMVEGVLAVDPDGNIISINKVAQDLLAVPNTTAGQPVWGCIRNSDIQNFISKILNGEVETGSYPSVSQRHVSEQSITYTNNDSACYHLQLRGTALRDSEENTIGALIMMNDITKMRKLENMRRDFVANVSHEIKTPLTAIKGSVETLKGGAIENKQDAKRFMKIISKHTDRLNNLIEDILSLSKIEDGADMRSIQLENTSISDFIHTAVDFCKHKADKNEVAIVEKAPKDLRANINPAMMEQVLVNLIDNAIKYSEKSSKVEVSASEEGDSLVFSVKDFGCGIPQEHIPRLFERFYRVDKARSRKLGGTGLGLAIVKHIVQAHKGKIDVFSELNEGTEFIVTLPC